MGWVPGARGCTPEACSFRDLTDEFTDAGAQIFGLSTQDPQYQQEAAVRLNLPYSLLSDTGRQLADALRLPTFATSGMTLLRRLTMILHAGKVEQVLYPVFPLTRQRPQRSPSCASDLRADPRDDVVPCGRFAVRGPSDAGLRC